MKKIFISYSSFEEKFVEKLKKAIESTFCCEIFAFKESLKSGDEWFGEIRKKLEEANLHIIILSPISVRKPWTYFEAGGTWIKKAKPIPMMLCLSENKISASNPLSKLWHGDFFKEKDVKDLFERMIKEKILLKNREDKKMKNKFAENIIDAIGDEYKILNAFRKIMKKGVSLHKRGIAPVPVILYEAFYEDYGELGKSCGNERDWLKEILDIEVDNKPNGTYHISTYSPAKLGEMIKHFEDLSRQGYIERVDTPLEEFLKETIKKEAASPAEVPDILFKKEKILRKINFKKRPLAGLKNYPIADENDIIVFLQTEEVIFEILKQAQITTGLSPEQVWNSTIRLAQEWWEEYKDYFDYFFTSEQSEVKVFNLGLDSSKGLTLGSFHSLLWNTHYKELGDFLRSWYKILV